MLGELTSPKGASSCSEKKSSSFSIVTCSLPSAQSSLKPIIACSNWEEMISISGIIYSFFISQCFLFNHDFYSINYIHAFLHLLSCKGIVSSHACSGFNKGTRLRNDETNAVLGTVFRQLNKIWLVGLGLTRWIKVSVSLLMLLVLFSPITIFLEDSIILMSSAMLTVFFIYYYVFNFICFGISENANMIYLANEEEEKEEISLPTQLKDEKGKNYQRVEEALKQWMERRGHLKTGITIQDAVDEMQIPRYLLTQWIKNTEYEVFSRWIAHLRVEEAKLLMTEHPEYSNEAVAKECGFSSRSYFQKVFRDLTGKTPMEFQSQSNSNGK